jgi:hypothetical protein
MISRISSSLVVLCSLLGGVGSISSASAQTRGSESSEWTVPHTAYGDPDLQGTWSIATITPFERPPDVTTQFYTPEEVERIEQGERDRFVSRLQPSDPDRDVLDAANSPGGYNGIYFDRGNHLAAVRGKVRTSIVATEDGKVPPLTAEGQRRFDAYFAARSVFGAYDHPELRPLGERCLVSFGSSLGPPMLPNYNYNNNYVIVQTPGYVMIMAEMVHDARIIRLGEPLPLPADVRPWFGDSWGHWEGNTLVVETTNMRSDQLYRRDGEMKIMPSEHQKVVERFTRADENTVLYEFEIQDPTTYTRPWGGALPLNRFDEQIFEYACHEGNYALPDILSGARYQEQVNAEGSSDN